MNTMVKTTIHLHSVPAPAPARRPRGATLRIGALLSVFAAVAAVLVRLLTDLPALAILVPVVIIGFTLSWFAASPTDGHTDDAPEHEAASG